MAARKKIVLAVDTSSDVLGVALSERDGKLLCRRGRSRRQEELLLKFLDGMLAQSGLGLSDLDCVAVIRGPGRFTGIRIGLTLAALSRRLAGAKAVGVTMFEAVAFQLMGGRQWRSWRERNKNGRLAVVVHAFRDEYFCAVFKDGNSGKPSQEGAERWLSGPQLLDFLGEEKKRGPLLCAGWGEKLSPLEKVLCGGRFETAPHKLCLLKPRTLVDMALSQKGGKSSLEPLYLKPAKYELLK